MVKHEAWALRVKRIFVTFTHWSHLRKVRASSVDEFAKESIYLTELVINHVFYCLDLF